LIPQNGNYALRAHCNRTPFSNSNTKKLRLINCPNNYYKAHSRSRELQEQKSPAKSGAFYWASIFFVDSYSPFSNGTEADWFSLDWVFCWFQRYWFFVLKQFGLLIDIGSWFWSGSTWLFKGYCFRFLLGFWIFFFVYVFVSDVILASIFTLIKEFQLSFQEFSSSLRFR
jgi:hypothetical protein